MYMQRDKLIEKSLILLRNDAIERGLAELAITLGWSIIRMRSEQIEQQMRKAVD
jgi:hypothetical protein